METTTIEINGCELTVEYYNVDADLSVGIEKGYSIAKLMLNDCEEFRKWKKKFQCFKTNDGGWEAMPLHMLSDMVKDCDLLFISDTPLFISTEMSVNISVLTNFRSFSFDQIKQAVSNIADFVYCDCHSIDVTDQFDHLEVANLIEG